MNMKNLIINGYKQMVKNNSKINLLKGIVDLKKAITIKALNKNVKHNIREKINQEYENFFMLK